MAHRDARSRVALHDMMLGMPLDRRRILVFVAHFHPHIGGVETFSRQLWQRLVQRGWSVVVLSCNTNRAAPYEVVDGLHVIRLPMFHTIRDQYPVCIPGRRLFLTMRALNQWKPQVVVTNTRFFTTSLLGLMFARRRNIPSLHIEHGTEHIRLRWPLGSAMSKLIDHTMGTWVVRHAGRCVGVSQAVVKFLAHLGRSDAGVLHNGVDAAAFTSGTTHWRQRLGIRPDGLVILYVGRLIEEKGLQYLIDAVDMLGGETAIHLILAGDGHFLRRAKMQAANRSSLHVLGSIPPAEVPALLAAADVFVYPSACREGLPTAILEAAAAGLPIVTTHVGGIEEIIPSSEHGLIVPPCDSPALQRALQRLLADQQCRRRLGKAVQRRVRAVFDWESVTEQAEAELVQLLG